MVNRLFISIFLFQRIIGFGVSPELVETANFLGTGTGVNKVDKDGNTLLQVAVQERKFELAKWLVLQGADANIKNKAGSSVLHEIVKHFTVYDNYLFDFIEFLFVNSKLKLNLNLSQPGLFGVTPVILAAKNLSITAFTSIDDIAFGILNIFLKYKNIDWKQKLETGKTVFEVVIRTISPRQNDIRIEGLLLLIQVDHALQIKKRVVIDESLNQIIPA